MKKQLLFLTLFTFNLLIAQVPSYVPTNGLVGYWPFNGNANDVSGNGNNGTVTGALLTTDRLGNTNSAYSFDDNSDYINCGNSSSVNITGSITLSAWINATNFNTENGIISKMGGYDLITSANNTIPPLDKIRWLEVGGFLFTNPIQQGTWLHIVATFDLITQTKKVYINGTLFASQAANITSLPTTIENLYIGSHQPLIVPSWSFNGKLDDIGIWNRALTQAEITGLYTTLSTEQTQANNQILIYPNPANDQITIDCGTISNPNGWSYKIVNALGQEVLNGEINNQQNAVSLSSLNGSGIYFVKIYDASNNLVNSKKIKLK
jgi:hypothetical protein